MSFLKELQKSLMIICIGCLLTACGDHKTAELQRYIKKVHARPARPIEPLPEFRPQASFDYPEHQRASPFHPLNALREAGEGPDDARPKEYLEAFPLDALRMVGTLSQEQQTWAVIAAPDGTIHRIRKGNYVGQNYGKVVAVNPQEIIIEETIASAQGWQKRAAKLVLSEEDAADSTQQEQP